MRDTTGNQACYNVDKQREHGARRARINLRERDRLSMPERDALRRLLTWTGYPTAD